MGAGNSREENEPLSSEELQEIPVHLRPKIEKHFLEQKNCIEELEAKYERLRVDSEQRYFELERNLLDAQSKLATETATSAQLKDQLSDTETKYNDTAQKFRDLQQKDFSFSKQMDELLRLKNQLEGEKHDLTELVDKKTREIDKLTDDWKSISQRVNEANKEKINSMAEKDQAQSQTVSLEHQLSRLNQEKTQFTQEKQWMEKCLKEKTDELVIFRKDKSSKLLQLQSQLDERVDELKHEHDLHETQKERNEQLQCQIENYIQKLKDQKNLQAQSEEQYRNEIQAQEKLIQIYKASSSEADNHVKELTSAVEELQNMLKHATKATTELENLRKEDAMKYEKDFQLKDQRIQNLTRELADANELLETARKKGVAMLSEENLEVLSPSAAAASRLLKSGMTLTQIYSEYVQATENLHVEKEENRRLNQYLDQILQEIEEKAPVMKKQRDDYEKLLQTVDQMTRQLDTAMLESEKLRMQAEDTGRRYNEVARENNRLKQQLCDLSSQVRMLLKELSEARGTMVHVDKLGDSRSSSVTSTPAQQVITDNLVTFKSIEELQEQNQKLMGVVRELTERHEEEETLALDSKTMKLNERLEQAAEEIEELKSARDRQEKLVESIVRQRDMYRVLLSQNTGSQMPMIPPSETSTPAPSHRGTPKTPKESLESPDIQSALLNDTKKAFTELQEEFKVYRREKGDNEKLLNSHLEKFRTESSELKMQNAKLATQLDYSAERYKVLQSNIEGYKKEISAITDKNSKFTTTIVKHEHTIAMLREDMMTLQGSLTKTEVQLQHLRSQNETLRSIEARLTQEKETSLRENRTSQLLMANLQAIQNNLERSEFETKTTLNNRIEALERENAQMKRKLDGAHEHQRNVIQSLEKQLTQARELLGQEDQSHRETQNLMKQQKIQIDTLTTQLGQIDTQHKAAQKRLLELNKATNVQHPVPPQTTEAHQDEIKDLKSKMNTTYEEIKSLKDQLLKARQHVEQYKTIADSMERNMTLQNKTSKEFKEKLESEVKLAKEASEESRTLLSNVEKEKEKLLEENIKLSHEISNSSEGLRTQLRNIQTELEVAVKRQEAAIVNEQTARKDMMAQSNRANEAQDKYERELMLHAADVNALTQVKEELSGFHEKLRQAEEACKDAKEKLGFEKHAWNEREKLMKSDRKKLQDRIDEILEQNSVLHDNLEQLSGQMADLQQRKQKDDKETSERAEKFAKNPAEKTPEQLLEVIKFLRKEKEIAEARLDIVQAESSRVKQQTEYIKKQLDDANKSIQEEREKSQITIQTAAQHADLLRKVENMNLLQDSNRYLREEKDRLNQKVKELDAKHNKLESEIDPIQVTVRELTAERDTVQAENTVQKGEIESWKSRANHLIEQCNKFDPEEFKQAVKDRDVLKKANNSIQDELNKFKAEGVNIKMQLASLKNEESAAKIKIAELTTENEKLKETVQAKEKDIDDKTKTINQLRNIGRKYRKQAEENKEIMDKAKQSQQQQVNVQELQQKLKAAEEQAKIGEEKLKTVEKTNEEKFKSLEVQLKSADDKVKVKETEMKGYEDKLKTTEECLKTSEAKRKAIEERLKTSEEKQKLVETALKAAEEKLKTVEQQMKSVEQQNVTSTNIQVQKLEREKSELIAKLNETEGKLKAVESSMQKLNEEISKLKESKQTLEGQKNEIVTERDKNKRLVAAARARLVQQKAEIDNLKKDIENLKGASQNTSEQDQRLKAIQSKMEKQQAELDVAKQTQQERDNIKQELDTVKRQNLELQQRTSQLQKLLETYQRQIQSPGSQTTTASEPPKTANIRPMTAPTSSPQVRMVQATPIQQVRSSTVAETRAMASIRPMAVSPVTGSINTSTVSTLGVAPTTQTPTATVHPTTQEGAEGIVSPLQVTTQVRPTQSVQPVSPHVDEIVINVSETQVSSQESSSIITTTTTQPSSSLSVTTLSSSQTNTTTTTVSVAPSSTQQPSQPTLIEVAPSTSTPVLALSSGSASATSSGSSKRQREDDFEDADRIGSQPEGPLKKTKTMSGDVTSTAEGNVSEAGSSQQPDWVQSMESCGDMNVVSFKPEDVLDQPDTQESTQTGNSTEAQEELPEFTETEDDEPNDEVTVELQQDTAAGMQLQASGQDIIVLDEEPQHVQTEASHAGEEVDRVIGGEPDYMSGIIIAEDPNGEDEFDAEYVEEEGEMEEQYEDEEGMEGAEEENGGQDDDCVVIDDEEEEDDLVMSTDVQIATGSSSQVDQSHPSTIQTQISSSSVGSSVLSSQSSDPTRLAPPTQISRLPSSGGRTQLQPFTFSGEGSNVEFGDDGIVPSTPTLFVPRRSDGFAEAISSPLVSSRQFVFGGQSEASSGPDFSQLGSEGLDAPYIDFSQFGGTPRSPQPHGIQITPRSPQPSGAQVKQTISPQPGSVIAQTAGDEISSEQQSDISIDVIDSTGVTQEPQQSSQVHSMKPESQEAPPSEPVSQMQATKPTLIEITPSEAGEEAPSSSTGASDAGKPKIEPIVWDKPSGSGISPRTATAPSRTQMTQPLLSFPTEQQSQPISSITHGVAKFTPGQQRGFTARGRVMQSRQQTAFRSRPSPRGGNRGAHTTQGGNVQQMGQRGIRGSRYNNRGTRGQYRGGHQHQQQF